MTELSYTFLGQVGFLFEYDGYRWVIDPYLSDYVENLYGDKFARSYPFDHEAVNLRNLDFCLITHAHEDHCDPLSLAKLIENNPGMRVIADMKSAGIIAEKLPHVQAEVPKLGSELSWGEHLKIKVVPSAHTELTIHDGFSEFNGYVMTIGGKTLYHPGDTIPHREIEKYLPSHIDFGFMPVNERNFFRDEMGIIGNMTCREAFQWSQEIGVKTLIATHWDIFGLNNTMPEEIDFIAGLFNKIILKMPVLYKRTILT